MHCFIDVLRAFCKDFALDFYECYTIVEVKRENQVFYTQYSTKCENRAFYTEGSIVRNIWQFSQPVK